MQNLFELSALELAAAIARGDISRQCVTDVVLSASAAHKDLNAFICSFDALSTDAPTSTLSGVPMAVKDNICVAGAPTTCGSRMLETFLPPYTATAAEKLFAAGAFCVGKTNLDEFAIGSTSETSYFGAVKNPWNTDYTAGGSSGGSAAAVACGQVWYSLGSDTGGSIRHPAACCGVTGMKPTYGTVSRYGLVSYASSFDQIGPICRDAADCAAVLDIIRGHDERDSTSLPGPYPSLSAQLTGDLKGIRIGIPDAYFDEAVDTPTRQAILACADALRQRGATVELCHADGLQHAVHAYYVLACAQASSNLARYDGVRFGCSNQVSPTVQEHFVHSRSVGFGREVKRRILLGTHLLSGERYETHYQKALAIRQQVIHTFRDLWQHYNLLLTPVLPGPPPKLGQEVNNPVALYQEDRYVACANLAGLPALSMPCGMRPEGLPIGAQLMGPAMGDAMVLQAAFAFQQETDWHRHRPPHFGLGGGNP